MKKKKIALLLISLQTLFGLNAQKPELFWSVFMSAIFDNREGDETYSDARTFFQTQLSPEIGLTLDGGRHRIAAGAVWTQPIGCEWEGHRISPTVYYRYEDKGLRFAMGMFDRDQLYRELPNYIWNDSVKYMQRNIRGAMIGYREEKGFFQAILDWRGMQTRNQREAFNIIAMGERHYKEGLWMWGGTAMMNHLAWDKSGNPDQHVVDNFLYNPYLGVDFSKIGSIPLDSCLLRIGILGSLTRDRGDKNWHTPMGAWVDFAARWKFLELKNTFYAGGKLFPIYARYGSILDLGEPYYAASLYDRLTVGVIFLERNFVKIKGDLDFNIYPGNYNFYQRVMVEFRI